MGTVLVVFYSNTGTSRRVAQLLASQLGWSTGEILEERRNRSGWLGTLRCVADSLFGLRPPVRYTGPAPALYDIVVLVSPIWLSQLASPMRTFISQRTPAELRKIAVISVMGGKGAPNAVAEIGSILGRSPLLATAFTAHEVDDGSFATRLHAFGQALDTAQADTGAVRPVIWSPEAV